jgi:hypothetical protein
MYDVEGTDTGREWIEVQNLGDVTVDFSTWKLFEANTNHKITAVGSNGIPAGGFAILADDPSKFLADHLGFSGLVFDSAFSLSNNGESLILRDSNLSDIDAVTFDVAIGAAGDGNSLQKINMNWMAGTATPGALNSLVSSPTAPSASSSNATTDTGIETGNESLPAPTAYSSYSSQSVAKISYDEPELEVTSGRPRLGFVGMPLAFEAKTKSSKNIPLGNSVSNVWSLGDGSIKHGQFINHTYEFSGEYIVILNSQSGGANAVSKVRVKIIEPHLSIISVNNSFIEIKNLDKYELNLGNMVMETHGARFIFPKDTIISPESSVKIPSSVTHLSSLRDFVKIINTKGKALGYLEVRGEAEMTIILI